MRTSFCVVMGMIRDVESCVREVTNIVDDVAGASCRADELQLQHLMRQHF